jgi:hypothetical protein
MSNTPKKKITKKKAAVQQVVRPVGRPRKLDLDEISSMEEPIYLPPVQKQRGRPKNENYIPYLEAREFMLGELIPSRKKYMEWWDRNKPKAIPRFPYRVYQDDWTSWNDFLGTNNTFGLRVGKAWRPLEEAASWVHKLKIESYAKWMAYAKENTLPVDIPARPDLVYAGWKTWMHWLGNRPIEVLNVAREAQRNQIYYVIHETGVPENIITFGLETMGQSAFKERWERDKFTIVRLFWYDAEQADQLKKLIDNCSTPYLGSNNQRTCTNMWEIIYYMELLLSRIHKF